MLQYLVGRVLKYRNTLRITGVEAECERDTTFPTTVEPEFQGLDPAVQAAIDAGNLNHSASSILSLHFSLSLYLGDVCMHECVYFFAISLSLACI